MLFFVYFFIAGFSFNLHAEETKAKDFDPVPLLEKALAKYKSGDGVFLQVEKEVVSEWKNQKKISTGKILYLNGKIRIEIENPEKELTIFDGKRWCNVVFASPDFPGKNKVTIGKVEKNNAGQFFLLKLIQMKHPAENFSISMIKDEGEVKEMLLRPKNEKETIKESVVRVDSDKKIIKQVSYKDDIGNVTTIKFENLKALEKTEKTMFFYKFNKETDQVTNL